MASSARAGCLRELGETGGRADSLAAQAGGSCPKPRAARRSRVTGCLRRSAC